MLIDSHCHLDFSDFAPDLDGVVSRAQAAGVGTALTICTHLSRFKNVLAVAERFDRIYCSVGIHPHEAEPESPVKADDLVDAARHPKVIGIGETGLDFHYDHSPRDIQERCFLVHIEAARRTGLPIIIHSRNADDRMANILQDEMAKAPFTGVMHCFSSGADLARTALDVGLSISLSGIVTFKKADELREIVRQIPVDRLLIETDAPYLAPVPHRGQRNEPAFVVHTAAEVARLKAISTEELAAHTTDNFYRLFSKAERAE